MRYGSAPRRRAWIQKRFTLAPVKRRQSSRVAVTLTPLGLAMLARLAAAVGQMRGATGA